MRCILAVDIGGSFLKAGLIGPAGEPIFLTSVQMPPLPMDARGFSEKNPDDWWEGFLRAIGTLLGSPAASMAEIAALAISGLTRTQVFLDGQGKVLRPAVSWADSRASAQAERILRAQRLLGERARTFGPMNAFHTLARVLWVKEREPEVFERLRTVLEPKDYINFRLTGERAGDTISLSRLLSVSDGALPSGLFDEVSLPVEIFPPLRDPSEQLGEISSGLEAPLDRLAGIPVFVGGMDAWCGALGIGAIRAGRAFNSSGTTEVFGIFSATYREPEGLVTLPWGEGLFQIGGPSQAGADCLSWFLDAFGGEGRGSEPGVALKGLQGLKRQPEPVLFFPYLRGERTPLWEPDSRAIFLGLNRRHGRADCIWAIMEGVAFSNRQILERAARPESETVTEVRITGGASASDIWCQVKADVLNRPVIRTRGQEAALRGAAMVALTGLGDCAGLEECEGRLVEVEQVFAPRSDRCEVYDRLFQRWIESQGALLAMTRALTKDAREGATVPPY
jgi:xylulokinase